MVSARSTVARRCAMTIAVLPTRRRSSALSILCSVAGSRREEASSSMTSPGSRRKTRAKASSCDSPADRPAARREASVEPVGQRLAPVPEAELAQHGGDPLIGDAAVEQRQVVANAGAEEMDVLGDDADRSGERRP